MTPTSNASREQTELFTRLYADEKKPLRAAAAEASIDIITATMLAQQTGHIRFTEAVIVNSPQGEQGRMGEDIFQRHLPEAVNCNTSIRYANPHYDFLLDGLRIDIKCSAGFMTGKAKTNTRRVFPCNVKNVLKTDCFVFIVKTEADSENIPESYRHCFIIPSLFLTTTHKLEICDKAVYDGSMAWHEFCYPIEEMADKVRQIAANKEAFAIPEDLKQAAKAHRELRKELNHAKRHRTTA